MLLPGVVESPFGQELIMRLGHIRGDHFEGHFRGAELVLASVSLSQAPARVG